MLTEEQVRLWLESLIHEPHYLQSIRGETERSGREAEQIFLSQATLLRMLVHVRRPKSVLELGTFMGYSTAVFANSLLEVGGGTLVTIDRESSILPSTAEMLEELSGVDIQYVLGDAEDECSRLTAERRAFDFVFLDVSETDYLRLYSQCVALLAVGGLLVIDNLLMPLERGWSNGNNVVEGDTALLHVLKDTINAMLKDSRVAASIVPIGSGMGICVRRHEHG